MFHIILNKLQLLRTLYHYTLLVLGARCTGDELSGGSKFRRLNPMIKNNGYYSYIYSNWKFCELKSKQIVR